MRSTKSTNCRKPKSPNPYASSECFCKDAFVGRILQPDETVPSIEELVVKVDLQQRIKEMEAERAKLRDGLFSHQDRVEKDKESLLDQVEEQLKLSWNVQELMTIHWTVT
jgi:hypothetical protein